MLFLYTIIYNEFNIYSLLKVAHTQFCSDMELLTISFLYNDS